MASIPTTTMRIDPQLKEESSQRARRPRDSPSPARSRSSSRPSSGNRGSRSRSRRKRRMADKVIRIKDLRPQDVRGFRGDTVSADGLVDWHAPHVAQ